MKQRKWLWGIATSGALFFGALWWNGRSQLKRFTSAPMADGTRFTFLYPARLSNVFVFKTTVRVDDNTRRLSALQMALPRLFKPSLNPNTTFLSVVVTRSGGITRSRRHDDVTERFGVVRHNTFLADSTSNRSYSITHSAAKTDRKRFDREDEAFFRSFQILPSGAPVPSP